MTDRMAVTEVQAALDRVSFLDWSFAATSHDDGVLVRIGAELDNSRHPGVQIVIDVHTIVPADALADPSALFLWLEGRLVEQYVHEVREFYRVDGVIFDDPHGAGG